MKGLFTNIQKQWIMLKSSLLFNFLDRSIFKSTAHYRKSVPNYQKCVFDVHVVLSLDKYETLYVIWSHFYNFNRVAFFHMCLSCLLNCTNSTKSR